MDRDVHGRIGGFGVKGLARDSQCFGYPVKIHGFIEEPIGAHLLADRPVMIGSHVGHHENQDLVILFSDQLQQLDAALVRLVDIQQDTVGFDLFQHG